MVLCDRSVVWDAKEPLRRQLIDIAHLGPPERGGYSLAVAGTMSPSLMPFCRSSESCARDLSNSRAFSSTPRNPDTVRMATRNVQPNDSPAPMPAVRSEHSVSKRSIGFPTCM